MNVAEVLVQCLENEGVRYVFGVPGEEIEDVLFALEDSPIRFVPTRHEQGAAFMANVWGRLTGKAGVCLATLGPGATNLITGIADAHLDKAPLVAITGQGGRQRLHHESHQYLDIVSMLRPITKWNTALATSETVNEIVRKAFKVAESEKPGATHIEISEDVAKQSAPEILPVLQPYRVRRPGSDYKAIGQTIALLSQAKQPLVIAGNGAIRKLASRHLTQFVTQNNIPVVSTFMGKGAVSDRLEQSLLSVGLGFKDYVMEAIEQADLVLTVGYDIAEYPPEHWNPKSDKTIVHIDFFPAEVYAHYQPVVEIVGDISAALWTLNQQFDRSVSPGRAANYKAIRHRITADLNGYQLQTGDAFTVPGTLHLTRSLLADEGLLISDVGSHKLWIARNFPTYCPNGCIISNGLASMGIALPGAIAAALADPDRPIVAAMGDGGFLMNAQELETAKRLGVGFPVVIFNDNDYGLISWKQQMARGRSVGTQISNPDFVTYAKSFGIPGYRPRNVSEFSQHLSDALTTQQLCIIDVPIDVSVNTDLVTKLETYWKE